MIIISDVGDRPPRFKGEIMLKDLATVSGYFDDDTLYEADLVKRYGEDTVNDAIDRGWLAHGWIPCGKGRRRCVVRLSESGRSAAAQS